MADSTGGYTDVQYLGHLVPALIALIAGLVIHSFIIGVNVTDWWKGRPPTAVDQIISSLGISRMCTQCIITLYVFRVMLLQNLYSLTPVFILDAVYAFSFFGNVWLTTLLSIVFYLKISTFHTRLFLYLRGVIVQKTVYFIVAVILLATVACFMPLMKSISDLTDDGANNITIYNVSMHRDHSKTFYNYLFACSIPTLFCGISSVLLFALLYHHTAQMKKSSNLSINLETYYSVMKFISLTFIYVIIYYAGHSVCNFYLFFYSVSLLWIRVILDFFPVLHSCYLIYRTPKLQSQMSKVLQVALQRKDLEPRENIQM